MAETDDPTQKNMLRWILGIVAAGLGSMLVWIGSQMKSDSEFTRKLVENAAVERMENMKAVNLLSTNIFENTKALESLQHQGEATTSVLKQIRDDQRVGVWRATEPPAPKPEHP